MTKEEGFIIFSMKRGPWGHNCVFYRPNSCGYTTHLEESGIYSEEEADEICANSSGLSIKVLWSVANAKSKSMVPFSGSKTFETEKDSGK